MTMREKLELLQQKRAESELGGGAERIKVQHEKGKMTARERLDALLDPSTFVELDERAGIEQRVEALARRHLPLLVLDLDALGAAAELGLGALLLEQLELLTHSHEQNLGSREQDG